MSKVARAARTATEVRQEAVRVGAAAVMEHNTHHAPWLTVLSLEVQQEAVTVGAAAVVMCDKKGNAALIRTSMPHGKMLQPMEIDDAVLEGCTCLVKGGAFRTWCLP